MEVHYSARIDAIPIRWPRTFTHITALEGCRVGNSTYSLKGRIHTLFYGVRTVARTEPATFDAPALKLRAEASARQNEAEAKPPSLAADSWTTAVVALPLRVHTKMA
jgi:hypothetical protein